MNEKVKEQYLAHFGIKGQKWGVRRFQEEDGSLTAEGRARYLANMSFDEQRDYKNLDPNRRRRAEMYMDKGMSYSEARASIRKDEIKRRVAIGAAVVASMAAAYGAYKVVKNTKARAYLNAMLSFKDNGKINSWEELSKANNLAGGGKLKFKEALRRNSYYKQEGKGIYASLNKSNGVIQNVKNNIKINKDAKRMYSGRKDLNKILDAYTKKSSTYNKAKREMYRRRMQRYGADWVRKVGYI
jgi:hypothetical protein